MAVTHASVSKATGISRSTLYRHWPKLKELRNDVFLRAATSPNFAPTTHGPLRADLTWAMGKLQTALNETAWGQVVPQVVSAAATDAQARAVIEGFMKDRIEGLESVFAAAKDRGEVRKDKNVRQVIEIAISVPYFRKLIAGLPLDQDWLKEHVEFILRLAKSDDS